MATQPVSDAETIAEQWVQDMRILLTSLPEDLWRAEADAFAREGPKQFVAYAPGSQAAVDAENCGTRAVNLILTRVQDALMGAADHMDAFDRALADPPRRLSVSPWTIARTVLEAEARASWMLESDSSAIEKVSRSVLLTIKDTEWGLLEVEQGRIADGDLAQRMLAKMQGLRGVAETLAQELDITVAYGTRFGINAVERVGACDRPSVSYLVHRLLRHLTEDETYYPMLSEVSHQSSFSKNLADIEVMPSIVFHVVYFFSEISWRYFNYCGRQVDDLVAVLEETLGQSAIPREKRFWEQRTQPQN